MSESIAYQLRSRPVLKRPPPSEDPKRSVPLIEYPIIPSELIYKRFCSNVSISSTVSMEQLCSMAKSALRYLNSKEQTNLVFVDLVSAAESYDWEETTFHISFIAARDSKQNSVLLFAETRRQEDSVCVVGCCVLDKVDSENPLGQGCSICCGEERVDELIHPGPRYGFRVVAGDQFKGYDFWNYRPSLCHGRHLPSTIRQEYIDCAKVALEYYNTQRQGNFRFAQITAGGDMDGPLSTIIHVNFLAVASGSRHQLLFFADVRIPMFGPDVGSKVVEGCCQLEKVDSGHPFGRCCGVCYEEVIHPSPKDGYRAKAGDFEFFDYDFTKIGLGIF